jgi:diguanylate cyclase (GGDEF)-like protein/PAS domain S-box-containing protein
MEPLPSLFSSPDFMTGAGAWSAGLSWLQAGADGLGALAYYAICCAALALLRHRADPACRRPLLLVGSLACLSGTSLLLGIPGLWLQGGWLTGGVKALTAVALLVAAVQAWRALPRLRAMPGLNRLLQANREMEEALEGHRRTEARLSKLALAVEHNPGMVLITDREGRIEYCNPSFLRISGYASEEMIGRRASPWNPDRIAPAARRAMWSALDQGEAWEGEILESDKHGDPYWCLEYVAPIRSEGGAVLHYIVMSQDITELKNSEEAIRQLAYFDPLTKLPNRALFKERLEQALRQAERGQCALALLHLDLDRFKNVNDSLGHDLADKVLAAVGERLRHSLREEDTLARLGADEFAVILPGLPHPVMAGAAATAIGEAMRRPFEVDGHSLFVTFSIGISLYPSDHEDQEQLLKMASAALHSAKEQGGGQYQYYKQIPQRGVGKTLALETGLRYALERGELEVHYQPKFDPASGRCCAAEALLRWRHPSDGLVPPGRFIPLAEETGLIVPIGEWLLREVCRQIGQWRSEGLDLAVAVNLSAQQFRQRNLLQRIDAILAETGADHARLEFEITESAAMGNPEQTALILRGMKGRGLALSIDDFGTGHSSLSYLKMFPVDYLKIDRSFVTDIDARADPRIVLAIIALAHSLDLAVVAEGVETREQFDFLKKHHCDLVQGYYCSRPLPPGELLQRLRRESAPRCSSPV